MQILMTIVLWLPAVLHIQSSIMEMIQQICVWKNVHTMQARLRNYQQKNVCTFVRWDFLVIRQQENVLMNAQWGHQHTMVQIYLDYAI